MPVHITESVGATITATHTFSTGTLDVQSGGAFKADVISESTADTGVTIDSVLLKDNAVTGTTVTATNVVATNITATGVTTSAILSTGAVDVTPTAGSSMRINLSGAGDFVVNTNRLTVDTSEGLVGVGTATPGALLHVYGGNQIIESALANGVKKIIWKSAGSIKWQLGPITGSDENFPLYCSSNSGNVITFIHAGAVTDTMYVSAGNVGFNQTTFGTSAAKVLAIGSGTAPSSSPADCVQMWSADRNAVAGKASLHIRVEEGTTHVIGDLVGLGTTNPASTLDVGGTGITLGGVTKTAWPGEDYFASGTKMWFYQDTAPTNWTIDATPADALLSVKGGSQAYNTTGGTQAGTWTQPNHTHSHSHLWYTIVAAVGKDGAGTPISNATSHDSGIVAHSTLGTASINNTNLYTDTNAATGATAATWRPLAQIGIICTKD